VEEKSILSRTPTPEEVDRYFKDLNNWGRWGGDDQAGTLNFITSQSIAKASQLIRRGRRISCARPVDLRAPTTLDPFQGQHFIASGGETAPNDGAASAQDWIGVAAHGFQYTHLDAHSHVFWKGKMYNGRPSTLCSTQKGAIAGGVEPAFGGIFGRGVFVDGPELRGKPWLAPGEGLRPAELDEWLGSKGVSLESGDLLFVRTGRDAWEREGEVRFDVGGPGLDASCLAWIREHELSVLVSDLVSDVSASEYHPNVSPIHIVGIAGMGLWLVDNSELGGLAEACRDEDTIQFFAALIPLTVKFLTGCVVNPIALF
jgi:kynurenine formamidase